MPYIDRTYIKSVLPPRDPNGHKGTFGKVLCVGGSVGYTGAPIFASRAAVRTGSGLVFLGVPESIWQVAAVKSDEAMPFPMRDMDGKLHGCFDEIARRAEGCDAVLYGCGLGRSAGLDELIRQVLTIPRPLVLDADGINALSGHINILDGRRAPTILTPHDGEFQRLTGCDLPILDRLAAARNFAKAHRCTLVLKGHATVTAAPDGSVWINASGNPGMAKGGSGDVLAGLLAGLLGQKHLWGEHTVLSEMVAVGVYYHGQAGDRCAEAMGEYGMIPTDLIAALPAVLKEHTRED